METQSLKPLSRDRDRKLALLLLLQQSLLLVVLCGCPKSGPLADDPMPAVQADLAVVHASVVADIEEFPSLGPAPQSVPKAPEAPQTQQAALPELPAPPAEPTPADAPTKPPEPPADSSPAPAPSLPSGDVPAPSSSTDGQAGGDTPSVSDETLAAFGAAIEAAADQVKISEGASQPPSMSEDMLCVYLFTQNNCPPCIDEKAACEKVQAKTGVTPLIINVDDSPMNAALGEAYKIGAYPTWVVLHPRTKNGKRNFYRYTGRDSNQRIPTMKVLPANSPPPLVAGAVSGPTMKVTELLPFVAGKTLKLGDKVTLEVPKDLKWTTSRSAKGATVLSFSQRPRLTIHKFLDWKLALEGVEITPTEVTLQLDNMPDVVVTIDWNFPK